MTKKLKLTGWYSGDQKPVRVGVYERQYYWKWEEKYCWFDGINFSNAEMTPEDAKKNARPANISYQQSLPWQGVLK